jgi:hypothetical protein
MSRWLQAAALLALLAAAVLYGWRQPPGAATGAISAVEIAGGDGGGLPRATLAAEHVAASALATAGALAREQGVGALLVARHAHLIFEYYHTDAAASERVEGGALTETLRWLCDTSTAADFARCLSTQIWQPLNAQAALLQRGSLLARPVDWLRVGLLLLGDGRFEGAEIVPASRVASLHYLTAAAGAEAFASRDLRYLAGPGRTRLWLVPSLALAVLQVAGSAGVNGWDETQLPNLIIRAVEDRAPVTPGAALLNQLVPGH